MKNILLLFTLLAAFSVMNAQQLKKLEKDNEPEKIKQAEKFAVEFFTSLKNGSFYSFGDNVIPEMKKQLTEQAQKDMYQQLKEKYGDYKTLEYAETWIQSAMPGMKIYRFKAVFDKIPHPMEIRVVIMETGKIGGFWIKPWNQDLT